jgi:hypothetical protein
MCRHKEVLDTTTNSRTYKIVRATETGVCLYCGPHSGCNAYSKNRPRRSWKKYRKHQWKGA